MGKRKRDPRDHSASPRSASPKDTAEAKEPAGAPQPDGPNEGINRRRPILLAIVLAGFGAWLVFLCLAAFGR